MVRPPPQILNDRALCPGLVDTQRAIGRSDFFLREKSRVQGFLHMSMCRAASEHPACFSFQPIPAAPCFDRASEERAY